MKPMSIRDIEESPNKGSVYVLNSTKGKDRGDVVFTVPKASGNGGFDAVIVPATFIPMDITEQVARRQLIQSTDFRKAIARKMLTLVRDDEAEELLAEEGVDEEVERLNNLREAITTSVTKAVVEGAEVVDPAFDKGAKLVEASAAPGVMQLMWELESQGDETAILNSLRSQGELERQDYEYIAEKVEKTSYERIKLLAKRGLNR